MAWDVMGTAKHNTLVRIFNNFYQIRFTGEKSSKPNLKQQQQKNLKKAKETNHT